ncbi:MAG: rhodanese-like domain-containing protein [Bacteroidota bacterium]|jgi:rhodanese-related sulfurtransferase
MREISVQELKAKLDAKENFQLIDVRESYEADICSLGGELIPMGDVLENASRIKKDIPVVIHCRSGKRSAAVIEALESQLGYTNLSNLKGGILAWADEIDPSMSKY